MVALFQPLESRMLMSASVKLEIRDISPLPPGGYTPPTAPPPLLADPWEGHHMTGRYTGTILGPTVGGGGASTFDLKVYDDYADVLTLGKFRYAGETTVQNGRLSFRFHGGIPYTADLSSTTSQRLTLRAKLVEGKSARGRLRTGYEGPVTRSTRDPLGHTTTRTISRWRMFNYKVRIQAAGVS